jgi:two-component SAPR family response regulator
MPTSGPIIVIEDDNDDQELLQEVMNDLGVPNILRFFDTCLKGFDYLMTTLEKPFLIISDINLPLMTGIELKLAINGNEKLLKKNIPFIFLSTNPDYKVISDAYRLMIQGYFIKPVNMKDFKEMMRMIIDYWKVCSYPRGY